MRQTLGIIKNNKTYCTLIATVILASYAVDISQEIDDVEPYPDYYMNILPLKLHCDYSLKGTAYGMEDGQLKEDIFFQRGFLKYWLNCFSYQVIGHDRIIPIIASVAIVYLTYVMANTITNNRIIGLVAMGAMTVNPLLTKFDSSPTYDQVWVVFFLLSVILLYKKPVIGFLVFPFSIISKILAAAFIPGMILNVIVDKRLKNRFHLLAGFAVLSLVGVLAVSLFGTGSTNGLYPERLLDGFLRIFESIWVIFPAVIGAIVVDRFFMPKQKENGKNVMIVWMVWILMTTPFIYLFTAEQLQFGYRFVPFAAFFSVYLGIVCVQLGNFITEARLRKQSLKH